MSILEFCKAHPEMFSLTVHVNTFKCAVSHHDTISIFNARSRIVGYLDALVDNEIITDWERIQLEADTVRIMRRINHETP